MVSVVEKEILSDISESAPVTYRLCFRKVGSLQYISHLDLQRTMARVLIRAGLPLWYTKGFNPHPKLVFALPLSVGAESECEYLDIKIKGEANISTSEIYEKVNAELTDELRVYKVYRPFTKFTDIAYAGYSIKLHSDKAQPSMVDDIKRIFTTAPLNVVKRTKSGEKETDIIPFIKSIDAEYCAGEINIEATLTANEASYLNPEYIVTVIKERIGLFSGDPRNEYYTIMRNAVYKADGKEFV